MFQTWLVVNTLAWMALAWAFRHEDMFNWFLKFFAGCLFLSSLIVTLHSLGFIVAVPR